MIIVVIMFLLLFGFLSLHPFYLSNIRNFLLSALFFMNTQVLTAAWYLTNNILICSTANENFVFIRCWFAFNYSTSDISRFIWIFCFCCFELVCLSCFSQSSVLSECFGALLLINHRVGNGLWWKTEKWMILSFSYRYNVPPPNIMLWPRETQVSCQTAIQRQLLT